MIDPSSELFPHRSNRNNSNRRVKKKKETLSNNYSRLNSRSEKYRFVGNEGRNARLVGRPRVENEEGLEGGGGVEEKMGRICTIFGHVLEEGKSLPRNEATRESNCDVP